MLKHFACPLVLSMLLAAPVAAQQSAAARLSDAKTYADTVVDLTVYATALWRSA